MFVIGEVVVVPEGWFGQIVAPLHDSAAFRFDRGVEDIETAYWVLLSNGELRVYLADRLQETPS